MTGMNYLMTLAYVKAELAKERVSTALTEFKDDESGVEGFVVALILIGIAAAAAIIFKDKILQWINILGEKIEVILNG